MAGGAASAAGSTANPRPFPLRHASLQRFLRGAWVPGSPEVTIEVHQVDLHVRMCRDQLIEPPCQLRLLVPMIGNSHEAEGARALLQEGLDAVRGDSRSSKVQSPQARHLRHGGEALVGDLCPVEAKRLRRELAECP